MEQEEDKLPDTVVMNSEITEKQEETKSSQVRSPFIKGLFWGSAFSLTAIISAILGATVALYTPISTTLNDLSKTGFFWGKSDNSQKVEQYNWVSKYTVGQPVNILVMGIDRVADAPPNSEQNFNGHSDTILLLRFDPEDKSLKMLSIPRDTRVTNQGLTVPKINQANVDGGPTLAAKVISHTLNDIPIHRYIRVTNGGFRELVDLLGGIEIYVPQRMLYEDMTQNLKIDLQPGWQTLNGEQSEQFARFRGDNKGDVGRVQRQQMVLKALKERLKNPLILSKLPQAIRIMHQYIDTNLTPEEIFALVSFSLNTDKNKLNMILLPGRFSYPNEYQLSYWIMDEDAKDNILKTYFDQIPSVVNFSQINNTPVTSLRIAIENTTNINGLATSVFNHLGTQNFSNCYFLNDSELELETTKIIVQKGNIEAAKMLQEILGLGEIDVSATGDLDSDITIKVGKDWSEIMNSQP